MIFARIDNQSKPCRGSSTWNVIQGLICFSVLVCFVSPANAHMGEGDYTTVKTLPKRTTSTLYLERKNEPWVVIEDGLKFQDVREGTGDPPVEGAMTYIMWRIYDENGYEMQYFEKHASDRFFFGTGDLEILDGQSTLASFEKVIGTMKEGGKRLAYIRADKAFGENGWEDNHFIVPPNTDLVLEVSLLWVRAPNPKRFTYGAPETRTVSDLDGSSIPLQELPDQEQEAMKEREPKE